ncbi:MAG: hypothetical protein Q9219_003015 [cf. Caloplaca sp. 3 TL-2023]
MPREAAVGTARLSTALKNNLISSKLASSSLNQEEYSCPRVQAYAIGPWIQPVGQVTCEWHESGTVEVFKSTFAVVPEESLEDDDFDVLIGGPEMGRIGLLRLLCGLNAEGGGGG